MRKVPGSAWLREHTWRMAAVLLSAGLAGPAMAQVCPAGTYDTFVPHNGAAPSQTVVANNNIYVGASRLQLSHGGPGIGDMNVNHISDTHYTGEPGIRLGQDGDADSEAERIETTLRFRDPANMAQYLPVQDLRFRLHDIDAGDRIRILAYDQNGTLIPFTAARFSLHPNTQVTFNSATQWFGSSSSDMPSNGRRGTIDVNFIGYQVREVVIQYYDTDASGTYTIAQLAGCSVPVSVYKTTLGTAGGPFSFTSTNTSRTGAVSVSTPAAGTPTQVDGSTSAGTQPYTVTTPGSAVTITESTLPGGWTLVDAACVNAAGTPVGNRSGNTYSLPAAATAAGAVLRCDFTNAPPATLTLRKTWVNAQVGHAVTVSATNPAAGTPLNAVAGAANETDAGVPFTIGRGTTYTITEAFTSGQANGYVRDLVCTGNSGAGAALAYTPNALSGTLTIGSTAAGVVCTFTNTRRVTDLRIEKTASSATVPSGGQVQFTLVVTNLGPSAVADAMVQDPAMAGLDCTASTLPPPTCSATTGAQCPAPLTAAALQGGVAIPALPSAGVVTFGLTCNVTASGF